jgi:hypothetical protein
MRTRPRRLRPVPLTEAMENPSLIAPVIRTETDDYGDPEEAVELAARREEGRVRHGFRSLLDELDP